MKKAFNNPLFTFFLGAIIFSGIAPAFAYSYLSRNVDFTPTASNWEVDNVSDAIDNLRTAVTSNYVYGEVTSSNYSSWVNVDLGFEPRMVMAIIPTAGGYLRAFVYIKDKSYTGYGRGGRLYDADVGSSVQLHSSGFKWYVYDSSWGGQTLKYYAFK